MKKGIAAVLLLLIGMWTSTFGQTDQHAKNILDMLSKQYDAYKTLQTNFSFVVKPSQGETYQDKGVLFLIKDKEQFHIDLNQQSIISDGKTTWSIRHEEREIEISETNDNTTSIGPSNLFTFYKKGFTYKSLANTTVNKESLRVIELTPNTEYTNYKKIIIRINKNTHIHDITVFDKSGNTFIYTIHTLYVNHRIPATTFQFNQAKYQGYELVDLR